MCSSKLEHLGTKKLTSFTWNLVQNLMSLVLQEAAKKWLKVK